MRLGPKRYIFARKSAKRKAARWGALVCCVLFLLCSAVYALSVMRPAFAALAENRAKELAVRTINEAISQKFSQEMKYSDIVEFERTDDNKINAVKSNLAGVNKLKSDLSLDILQKISALNQDQLKVPLGSLMGNDIFAGSGRNSLFR